MAIDIEAQKQLFKNLVSKNIHRDGIDELMNWLENETDFFTAPASTRFHCAEPGGLCLHSLNVARETVRLLEHTITAPTIQSANLRFLQKSSCIWFLCFMIFAKQISIR